MTGKLILAGVLAIALASGLGLLIKGGHVPASKEIKEIVENEEHHEEKEAVRRWLKENTPSGVWEEIRWWGPIKKDDAMIIRLKYRTANRTGAQQIEDMIFFQGASNEEVQVEHQGVEVQVIAPQVGLD